MHNLQSTPHKRLSITCHVLNHLLHGIREQHPKATIILPLPVNHSSLCLLLQSQTPRSALAIDWLPCFSITWKPSVLRASWNRRTFALQERKAMEILGILWWAFLSSTVCPSLLCLQHPSCQDSHHQSSYLHCLMNSFCKHFRKLSMCRKPWNLVAALLCPITQVGLSFLFFLGLGLIHVLSLGWINRILLYSFSCWLLSHTSSTQCNRTKTCQQNLGENMAHRIRCWCCSDRRLSSSMKIEFKK